MKRVRANRLSRGDLVVGKVNDDTDHLFPERDQYEVLALHKVRRNNNTGPLEIRVQTAKGPRFLELNRIMLVNK